ncbi:Alkylated DNA repair protein [Burkholderia dolosa AU0158]|nr:Alkylated DNA repair protein [Burkholderia dolosa AU0158]
MAAGHDPHAARTHSAAAAYRVAGRARCRLRVLGDPQRARALDARGPGTEARGRDDVRHAVQQCAAQSLPQRPGQPRLACGQRTGTRRRAGDCVGESRRDARVRSAPSRDRRYPCVSPDARQPARDARTHPGRMAAPRAEGPFGARRARESDVPLRDAGTRAPLARDLLDIVPRKPRAFVVFSCDAAVARPSHRRTAPAGGGISMRRVAARARGSRWGQGANVCAARIAGRFIDAVGSDRQVKALMVRRNIG